MNNSKILDGKLVANSIKEALKKDCKDKDISLTIFQVGDNPASNTYIRNKQKACEAVGIRSELTKIEVAEHEQGSLLPWWLTTTSTDGVMLQLPLPLGWEEHEYVNCIPVERDADCLSDASLGAFYSSNNPVIGPCTAMGIIDLLDYYQIPIEGKKALVVGRSNIVGKPIAHLLTCRNATVTVAHSKTSRLQLLKLFNDADIVVIAVGKPDFITAEDQKYYNKHFCTDSYINFYNNTNRIIIDVGINRDAEGKLCGDLSEEFKEKYSKYYTPVPGGVGPMTVAELLKNTVYLSKKGN